MSFDLDKKEFYQTFIELQENEGTKRALEWSWSALDWTQQELKKYIESSKVDGLHTEIDLLQQEAHISRNFCNNLFVELDELRAEIKRLSGVHKGESIAAYTGGALDERAAVVDLLRECMRDTDRSEDDLDYVLAIIERGEHRRDEEKE